MDDLVQRFLLFVLVSAEKEVFWYVKESGIFSQMMACGIASSLLII